MRDSPKSERTHVPDEDLVLLENNELAKGRSASVRRHLESCERCLNRLFEIQRTLADYVEARRAGLDPQLPSIGPSRAELQRRLEDARAQPRSWFDPFTLRPAGSLAWGPAILALVAVTVVLAPRLERMTPTSDPKQISSRFAPDPRLTPGLSTRASHDELCASQPSPTAASIDRELAIAVFRVHGIRDPQPRAYEVDYLIPLELGGAKDTRNLWPQPYGVQPWNAFTKDALEDHLLRAVCDGRITLQAAQRDLATDWVAAYRKHFRTREPLVEHASFLKDEPWE